MAAGVSHASQGQLDAMTTSNDAAKPAVKYTYSTSWPMQFMVLLWRAAVQKSRDFVPLCIQLTQAIFLSVLLGLIYKDIKMN